MNAVAEPDNYVLSKVLVNQLAQIINTMPYGQVAPVAMSLGQTIDEQRKQYVESMKSSGGMSKFPQQ